MQPIRHADLRSFNTFGLDAHAAWFVEADSIPALRAAARLDIQPKLILGGGSNMLFTADWPGLVIRNAIRGMEVVRRFPGRVWVRVGAGTVWHEFVEWSLQQGLGGLENLSLIPGTAGAAPVQNIGAYGVELKDVFVNLRALDMETGRLRRFTRTQCRFGYRDSIFKREAKGRYCITDITLSLTSTRHRLRIDYGDIRKELEAGGIDHPTPAAIGRAVTAIRRAKLPDPAVLGNCGSFFKNPEIDTAVLQKIREQYPQAPNYPTAPGKVKVPAGWLIEQCGWKGKRVGNTGCYEKQALVLVNYGNATGSEVVALAQDIIASVETKFAIRLEPEVNIL